MHEGLDTGDTFLMETTEILPEDTASTLSARLSVMGSRLLLETIDRVKEGSVRPVPQKGEPSYAPIIRKDDGKIVWNRSALDIFNLVRGMFPWPGAFGFIRREKIILIKTKVMGDKTTGAPGVIERIWRNELLVSTGRGVLSIIEMKPEGRQSMSGASFARGRHMKEGMSFDL
jgi:methionyl-tRNA formyltransferase